MSLNKTTLLENDMLNQVDAIFQYATEAIIITNESGIIIKANPSSERLFQYNTNEIINQPIEILIPNKYKKRHEAHRESYNLKVHPRAMGLGYDIYAKRKDGTNFPVEVSLSPFSTSEGKFVIAFIVEITNRKKLEDQQKAYQAELESEVEERTMILKEAIHKLEQTKDELDNALIRERELNSMKSRFISIASHEFRTPLTTILSSVSLIEKYINLNDEEKRHKHTNRIKSSIINLIDILNDFLSLNKLEEGKVFVNEEEFDIFVLIDNIVQDLKSIAKKGQNIAFYSDNSKTAKVNLDIKLVKNIIINLLSNAIKFSHENSSIKLECFLSENEVVIFVKDQGIGIPIEDQKHLYERFFRSSNAGEIQGTGLGLSIVLQYIHLLKGDISCVSEENCGTEFKIVLPRNL
jgi:PAS domain S-box-containing protein